MLEKNKVETWIVDWFAKNSVAQEQYIKNNLDANYFNNNLIDSFKFISLIMDIEQHFAINFSNDEFQNREFSTIKGLSEIIYKRLNNEKL